MGYSTWFNGDWEVTPPLKPEHREYLLAFNATRRVARDEAKAEKLPDPKRLAVGLPIGFEGAYYVGSEADGNYGQSMDESVLDGNNPPGAPHIPYPNIKDFDYETETGKLAHRKAVENWHRLNSAATQTAQAMGIAQPGLWCGWRPNEDGTVIEHDGGEKFYDYTEWIQYLVHHFLEPWGYKLNGDVY